MDNSLINNQIAYANSLANSGCHIGAIKKYTDLLNLNPNSYEIYFNLGNSHLLLCQYNEAVECYIKSIDLCPTYVGSFLNLAVAYSNLGNYEGEFNCINKMIEIEPENPQYRFMMGLALSKLGKKEESLVELYKALSLQPNSHIIYYHIGNVLSDLSRFRESIDSFSCAIKLNNKFFEACFNLGNAYLLVKDFENSIFWYKRTIELNHRFANTYINMAAAYANLGLYNEELNCYNLALDLENDLVSAYYNRGNFYIKHGLVEKGISDFKKTLELDSNHNDAKWNLAVATLLSGDLISGFEMYESRWQMPTQINTRPNFIQPELNPDNINLLKGKTVYIYSEQGYGDIIQFARYIPMLVDRGANVLLNAPLPLKRLLSFLNCQYQYVDNKTIDFGFDFHAGIMSLAYAFGTNIDTIPNKTPYLVVENKNKFKSLVRQDRFNVGIVWSGGVRTGVNDSWLNQSRNVKLSQFLVLDHPKIQFYSLQKGDTPRAELDILKSTNTCNLNILDYTDMFTDFADTAEFIENIDLVISVDTAIAHLAGALGKKVFLINRYDTDWRWLQDRSETMWYPTMKIFRQKVINEWDYAFNDLKFELFKLVDY